MTDERDIFSPAHAALDDVADDDLASMPPLGAHAARRDDRDHRDDVTLDAFDVWQETAEHPHPNDRAGLLNEPFADAVDVDDAATTHVPVNDAETFDFGAHGTHARAEIPEQDNSTSAHDEGAFSPFDQTGFDWSVRPSDDADIIGNAGDAGLTDASANVSRADAATGVVDGDGSTAASAAPTGTHAHRHASAPKPSVAESCPDPLEPTSPADTAEIDVAAVEARLSDPGSTQSFEAITEERIDTDSTFDAGTSTSLMWGARSDVGCVRSHNEDSYLVASPLFCVCDGMGGHAAGEVASSLAVETIAKMAPKSADPALLAAAIEAANARIIEAAVNGLGKPGMGCTATAAHIEGTTLAIAHVGDSRAYLLHEGTLIRVTRDHSYVEELVDAGEITADEARVHPNRSVITRALGSDPAMYADHFQLNIEEGDRLILCSDGLSSMIPDSEIEAIATQSSTAQMCTDNLVDAALAAGGGDNVTVVVVDVVNDGRLRQLALKRRRNVIIALVALLAVLIVGTAITFASIVNSVYLGVKDEAVAVYTGIPASPFGLKLHWLEDETSIRLKDLPQDTQNRLRAGIPQESIEEANETITSYREQIAVEQERQIQDAEAIRRSMNDTNDAAPDAAHADANAANAAESTPPEGGAAQ